MNPFFQASIATLLGAIVMVVGTEALKRLWAPGYFSARDFVVGFEPERTLRWRAVAMKFAVPLIAGFLSALAAPGDRAPIGLTAALAGAFALVWPVFLIPDATPPELYGRELELRTLHVAFVGAAASFGFAGGLLAEISITMGGAGVGELGGEVARGLLTDALKFVIVLATGALIGSWQGRRSKKLPIRTASK